MKAQTGRPKSNNPMDIRYSVRLDADTESQLHAYCERTNITRGEAVRLGIKLLLSLKKERLEHMKIYEIQDLRRGPRHIKAFTLETERHAKYCEAKFLMKVREMLFSADLYYRDNVLYLDTPQQEATARIGGLLHVSIEACEDI